MEGVSCFNKRFLRNQFICVKNHTLDANSTRMWLCLNPRMLEAKSARWEKWNSLAGIHQWQENYVSGTPLPCLAAVSQPCKTEVSKQSFYFTAGYRNFLAIFCGKIPDPRLHWIQYKQIWHFYMFLGIVACIKCPKYVFACSTCH